MEMSVDVLNASEPFKFIKKRKEEISSVSLNSQEEFVSSDLDSIVDMSKINFEDDLTWLYECTNSNKPQSSKLSLSELKRWLYEDTGSSIESFRDSLEATKTTPTPEAERSFDSRTFTRPKKNENRPSIERLTGEYFGNISGSRSQQSSPRRISTGLLDTTHTILKEDVSPTPQVQSSLSRRQSVERNDSLKEEVTDTLTQPLQFDLTNQTSSCYFESILANNGADADSFQNMSPPSLVNSMCSSTFTNLMENSYIKNDPQLREIRDTDFTDAVLMQEAEPTLCQSMSESCSSLNSDSPENFLRKVSMNGSFKRNLTKNSDHSTVSNETAFLNGLDLDDLNDSTLVLDDIDVDAILNNTSTNTSRDGTLKSTATSKLNGTYRRPSKYATYRKSDSCRNSPNLESAFISPSHSPSKDSNKSKDGRNSSTERDQHDYANTIVTVESPRLKRRFERSQMQIKEMLEKANDKYDNTTFSQNNKISELNKLNTTHTVLNATFDKTYKSFTKAASFDSMVDSFEEQEKLNSTFCKASETPLTMACSSGSVESLDRLSSSLSNTSLSSSRMLYDADGGSGGVGVGVGVGVVGEIHTQNFNAISTPRPISLQTKLWDNDLISPITSNSCDTDQSSSDEFQSARSNVSKKTLIEEDFNNEETYIAQKPTPTKPRSVNTVPRNLASMAMAFRSSYTNLQKVGTNPYGSQPSLNRVTNNSKPSNLKTVKNTLRGSYTSLRPISAGNLPVAPPISKHNSTVTVNSKPVNSKSAPSVAQISSSNTRISEMSHQFSRTKTCGSGDGTFIVPNPPRTSGLPRPVGTGIPRPVSRIPGPRPSRSSSALQKKTTGGY